MAITKIIASRHNHRTTLIPFPGGVDDGSTLTLDFTTGVLDPRLTFDRTSTATFINSSGLVQFANANMVVNADFVGAGTGNAPTAWTGSTGINLSIPATGVRRAETTTAAQNWIQSSNLTTSNGLTYSTSAQINAVSGQHYANTMTVTGGATLVAYYLNGSVVGQFTTAQPGLLTMVWTATGTHNVRIGVAATGVNVANAVCEFTQPRTVPGNFTQPAYFANSSTTAAYHAPRFDYDPTTLAPKGLLIEGQAVNLLNWSESFATSGGTNNNWADTNITRNSTNNTDPANGTSALRVTASAGNGTIISTAAIGTSAQRTFSIWLRRVSGTGDIQYTLDNGSTYTTQAITSSWVRYTFAATTANHRVGIRIVTSGDSIELWGAQLETGSGASSYIPTGASQVTRTADSCSIPLSSFGFVTTGGTFQVNYRRGEFGTQNRSALNTDYVSGRWLGVSHTSASSTALLEWWGGSINRATQVTGPNKYAYSFGANTGSGATLQLPVSLAVNGSTTSGTFGNGTTNGADVPNLANITNMVIGAASQGAPYTTANRDFLNNCVSLVKYWPTRLPDAQLQSLTT